MSTSRVAQSIGLRNLSRGSLQTRNLYMTGPVTHASVITTERPVLNLPRDIAVLRKSLKIEATGSKFDGLNSNELANSRAFNAPKPVRHLNISRTLKAVNDSSTMDFAYFPELADPDNVEATQLRVPVIPTNLSPPRTGAHAPEPETIVMKPQISTMSADAVYLPMSDLSDGHAMNIDFHAMADRVSNNLRRMKVPVEEQASMMKQLWDDMVDDMFGNRKKAAMV